MKIRLLLCALLIPLHLSAAEETITVHALTDDPATKGIGKVIGTVTLRDTEKGLALETNLRDLPPGKHGFHIHEKNSCEGAEKDGKWTKGEGAGGHYDPAHTGKHLGPKGSGHKGDLPVLVVNAKGEAHETLYAPHLKVADLAHHSIMIHEGGDNYADQPKPMGGGGPRIACGVFP